MITLKKKFSRALALATLLPLAACGAPKSEETQSDVLVTSVDHTTAKRQSIGNCWIYAQATWLESLTLADSGATVDVSESYWTWWHWYDQILSSSSTEIQTGGRWDIANRIALQHGWVTESEFIEDEAGTEMSVKQQKALDAMNAQLKPGGTLATAALRTPANVRKALDKAFGVKMADAEAIARTAEDTVVAKTATGADVTMRAALAGATATRWSQIPFPRIYGEGAVSATNQAQRKTLLKRVLRALNDRQPVVMSLMIDFNALDITDQTFKASTLAEAGLPGKQGGHMVVLHDYVVKNVPGVGTIAEGEVSAELKTKALDGDLVHLKAKNSWGKNRPDRGLTDGYTRFDMDYMTKQLEWTSAAGGSSHYTTLSSFVLPPGY